MCRMQKPKTTTGGNQIKSRSANSEKVKINIRLYRCDCQGLHEGSGDDEKD